MFFSLVLQAVKKGPNSPGGLQWKSHAFWKVSKTRKANQLKKLKQVRALEVRRHDRSTWLSWVPIFSWLSFVVYESKFVGAVSHQCVVVHAAALLARVDFAPRPPPRPPPRVAARLTGGLGSTSSDPHSCATCRSTCALPPSTSYSYVARISIESFV